MWFYAHIFNLPEAKRVVYLLLLLTLFTQHRLLQTQTRCHVYIRSAVSKPSIGYIHTFDLLLPVCCFLKVSLKVTCQFNQSCFHGLQKDEALHLLDRDWNRNEPSREGRSRRGQPWYRSSTVTRVSLAPGLASPVFSPAAESIIPAPPISQG